MKYFIIQIVKFLTSIALTITMLVILTSIIGNRLFDFQIPKEKNILVLGNSHPECAINDKELSNVFNLAQSGSAYFYDYLKLKEIVHKNQQIDTVILGYTYTDLSKEMDLWFTGEDKIKFKLRNYFILLNTEDYTSLLISNPIKVIANTPQTIVYNLLTGLFGYPNLGGFKHLERNKIKEAKQKLKNQNSINSNLEISKYQSEYLKKIYTHCKEFNITLILLGTPIHPLEVEYRKELIANYTNFAKQKLPEAILVDHSNFKLPDSYYADLDHLNYEGANVYTNFLKRNNFKQESAEIIEDFDD